MTAAQIAVSIAAVGFIGAAAGALIWRGVLTVGRAQDDAT